MSLSQRYTDNVKAITLLKELGAKSATEDQISILAKYTGWGGFSSWFTDIENADKIDHLHSITSEDEFNSLFRGILDAFYTPQPISACIFEHFKACGLKSSHKVLDPAFGLGSLAKPFMGNANVYGIEKDILTAQISKKVYPQANIKQQGFEENSFPNKYFDAIVCNPPFGSHTMIDPLEKHYSSLSIHEHFILRSLDLLAEKGLFALIVTSGFLDSHNAKTTKTRKLIDDRTNIKNIFRLPTSTFNASGTSVSVDLLILEKKSDEEITFSLTEGETNPILINKTSRLEDIDPMAIKGSINDFFIHNRECILGDSKVISDQFGNFSVVAKGTNENALLKIKSNLTRFSMDPVPFEKEDPLNFTSEELGLKDADQINMFEYFYSDVVNCYVIKTDSNTFLSFPAITKSSKKGKIIEHSIRLANQLSKLLMLESSNADHSLLAAERDLLNSIYDDFSSKFGAINNTRNNFLLEDNRIMTVYGLECDYKRKITERQATKQDVLPQEESWTKAQIFNERILQPSDNLTFANTEIEALTFSLIKTGEVDFNYMTSISNFNTDQLISSLAGGYIFMNPVTMNYEVKDRYVSGNLRKKLREVKNYNGDLDLTSNIDVLTKSLPVELKPHELKIPFMAGWIPVKYLEDFITHITGSTDNEVVKIQGSFHCSLDFSNSSSNKKYGTEDVTASNLLQDIINKKAIKVYRKIGTERILDEEATLVASVKAEEIKAEWDNYLNNDPKKLHELCSIYNETVNCYSLVKYNGEHLTIAKGRYINQSTAFEYNKHQIDCIWRQLIQRGGLIAHTVGAGKTSVAIGVTYLGVEMGIYSNPIIPVLSNTLHQWYSEYKRIFPQARVLLIDDNNKSSKSSSRRRLLSRVSTEKWHAIICSHETFTSIEKPVDGTRQVIKEMKDECDSLEIEKYLQDNEDTVTGRYISRKIEATNTRIQKAINKSTLRKGYGFELLNTNYICIDESDAFKNMMFYTAFNDLRGLGSPSGSGRAFDCLCKIRHVNNKHRNDCKGLTLITGSPITNSISETFTLARYLYAEQLAEQNLNSFDAFVTTYCSPSTEYEITCTGEYKLQTRLRDFSNLMELNASFRAFSDCVTNEHLIKEYEKNGDVWPIPELEGGKPIDIVTEPGKEFLAYNDALIKRTENLETKSDKRLIGLYPNDNKLSIISNSETAALDLRLAKDISNYDIPLTDYKNSKIDAVVANTVATFKEKLPHEKTAQLIFIDKGTPKKNSDSFSVYHLIKQKLISAGLHAHEIEFIHDATNSQQRSEMFARVRSAKTRVLISSTAPQVWARGTRFKPTQELMLTVTGSCGIVFVPVTNCKNNSSNTWSSPRI